MAARTQVTWAELRVGVFVLLTLILLASFAFYATGGGALFTAKVSYVTYLPTVSGLSPGAPVRLMGLTVGSVQRISLREFQEDPSRRTEVRFQIASSYQHFVRDSSVAFITTEGLLGESVLEIETESLAGEGIPPGGVVPGTQRGDIKQIVQNVDAITGDVRSLIGDVRAGQGTLGALFVDPALYNRANRLVGQIETMTRKAAAGEGTLGRLIMQEDIYERIHGTVANVEQITTDVRAGKGTIGGLLYDKAFYDKAVSLAGRADDIIGRVQAGEGTLGKLVTDDALHADLKSTFQNLADITRKVNEGQGTIGRAVHDTRMYENINNFTSELRALISDFRKNPKKYLRIKASLF